MKLFWLKVKFNAQYAWMRGTGRGHRQAPDYLLATYNELTREERKKKSIR